MLYPPHPSPHDITYPVRADLPGDPHLSTAHTRSSRLFNSHEWRMPGVVRVPESLRFMSVSSLLGGYLCSEWRIWSFHRLFRSLTSITSGRLVPPPSRESRPLTSPMLWNPWKFILLLEINCTRKFSLALSFRAIHKVMMCLCPFTSKISFHGGGCPVCS